MKSNLHYTQAMQIINWEIKELKLNSFKQVLHILCSTCVENSCIWLKQSLVHLIMVHQLDRDSVLSRVKNQLNAALIGIFLKHTSQNYIII